MAEVVFVLLSCHHCEFTCPGELGADVLAHQSTVFYSPPGECRGSSHPSKCFCPGVMRSGCPCSTCHGRGWTIRTRPGTEDEVEMYCDCPDGAKRRKADGV